MEEDKVEEEKQDIKQETSLVQKQDAEDIVQTRCLAHPMQFLNVWIAFIYQARRPVHSQSQPTREHRELVNAQAWIEDMSGDQLQTS